MNTYTRQFQVVCPNNGLHVSYVLSIQTDRVIPVEAIVSATEAIGMGYHEDVADELHARFGGHQRLVAHHHGVDIETIRDAAAG